MKSTISGFWQSVTFYCSSHPDEKLVLKQGGYSTYYGCPHEYDETHPCHNRLNLIDAEKALQHIMDILNQSLFDDQVFNMTNYTFTKNGVKYTIISHDTLTDKFEILVENNKMMMNR